MAYLAFFYISTSISTLAYAWTPPNSTMQARCIPQHVNSKGQEVVDRPADAKVIGFRCVEIYPDSKLNRFAIQLNDTIVEIDGNTPTVDSMMELSSGRHSTIKVKRDEKIISLKAK